MVRVEAELAAGPLAGRERPHYRSLASVYIVDADERKLQWWSASPAWMEHPMRVFSENWPQWTAEPLHHGPDAVARCVGIGAYLVSAKEVADRARALLESGEFATHSG